MTLIHELFISQISSLPYYSTAAIFDLMSMILMSNIKPTPILSLKLNTVCVVSIALNFYGWLIYILYIKPTTYDIAFIIVYAVVIYLFLVGDRERVDSNTLGRRSFNFYIGFNTRINNTRKKKSKL